jgi:20S proteasome subunit alpha 3
VTATPTLPDRTHMLMITVVEFATVGKTKDGRIYHHLWSADEITALLKEHDLAREETAADGDRIIS